MSHLDMADQAFSAWVPTVGSHHVGADRSSVDEYKVGGVKQPLLADPASPRSRPRRPVEVVLGIDNLVFISILVSRCTGEQALRARQIGLSLAFVFRVVMLFGLTWLMKLTYSLFSIFGVGISWRDIILIGGGLFLIAKETHEIHGEVEPRGEEARSKGRDSAQSFAIVVTQLIVIDIVFSLDSIITAIGMVDRLEIMIAAVVFAMIMMYVAPGLVTAFIAEHPTTKMLALAFLLLIGGH
jgi:predicted tellurium resistance membrane protein TerC